MLRILIMSGLYSSLITFVGVFNAKVLFIGHKLGVNLANYLNIDPYIQISTMGAGIAYDVMLILFISVILIEVLFSEKVCYLLEKINKLLYGILDC